MQRKTGMGLLIFGTGITFSTLMIYYALNVKLGIGLMIIVQFSNIVGIDLITKDLERENLMLKSRMINKLNK